MVNVGIIGASFARQAYLPAFALIPEARVVALASERIERAEAAAEPYGIDYVTNDWQEMLENQPLDLVCIATPTVLHLPMTLAALAKGANVLCEKPTAMNASEARTILDAARQSRRIHMINHELRFNPTRARIADMIHGGEMGQIHHVNISNISSAWADPTSRPKGDWWSDIDFGGGRLGANGSHQVDLLRWWLGEPKAVFGQALTIVPDRIDSSTGERWTATADDLCHFTLEMQTGALVQVFISSVAAHDKGNLTQIFGSKGTLDLSNSDEILRFSKAGEKGCSDISVDNPHKRLDTLNKGIWNVSVLAALQELVAAISESRGLSRGATFVDGLRNQMVLDAVLASTKQRCWQQIDMSVVF